MPPPISELVSVNVAKVCNVVEAVAKKRGRGTQLQIGMIVYENTSPRFIPAEGRLSCPATGRPIEASVSDVTTSTAPITCRGGCRADWFYGFTSLPAPFQRAPSDS